MVVVVVVTVLALTLVAVTGHLRPLSALRVRAARLLVAAAVVQVGTASLAPGSTALRVVALVVTILLVGLFLGGNLGLPGMPLIAAGLLLNVVVIVANGAMPVSTSAADGAGVAPRPCASPMTRSASRSVMTPGCRCWPTGCRSRPRAGRRSSAPGTCSPRPASGCCSSRVRRRLRHERHRRTGAPGRAGQAPRRADRSMALAMESTTRGSYS